MQGIEMQNRPPLTFSAATCCRCGATISADETAITKKLISRGTQEGFCVSCLAAYFDVSPEDIRERIAYFRSIGCTLFTPE